MVEKVLGLLKVIGVKYLRILISALSSLSEFLLLRQKSQDRNQSRKDEQRINGDINDVCDHGTLDDLLDLSRKTLKMIAMLSLAHTLSGCMTEEPTIQATKPWESHYMNERDFLEGTRNIRLERNESIWVLSNATLSRLIKDLKDNNR